MLKKSQLSQDYIGQDLIKNRLKLRYNTLCSLIKFKQIMLIVLRKDNMICASLMNTIICLILIGKPNAPYLKNCT